MQVVKSNHNKFILRNLDDNAGEITNITIKA